MQRLDEGDEVMQRLDEGDKLESTEIKLKLSTMKPLHTNWLIRAYKHVTTVTGREIYWKGWVKSGIIKDIENRSIDISTLDAFFEIDPTEKKTHQDQINSFDGSSQITYITDNLESDSDCEWEDNDDNIFAVFNNEEDVWLYYCTDILFCW